jgi:vesicle coat complex subunit
MKPSEKQVLETLRATGLAHISESDFASIEKSVEEVGIMNLTGTAKRLVQVAVEKAVSVQTGDMVSWNSSGGRAEGKVSRIIRSGKINVPDSSFSIEGTEDDPAALIVLYRDGKPTDTKVGHKVSTLKKK